MQPFVVSVLERFFMINYLSMDRFSRVEGKIEIDEVSQKGMQIAFAVY